MDSHRLKQIDGPWLHTVIATPADLSNQVRALEHKSTKRLAVRVVRGRKATTTASILDEFAAALQFPLYFGENWDALNDCLGDLDWLNADEFVLVIADAAQLLSKGSAQDLKKFFQILDQSTTHWRSNGVQGMKRPYHVVLHAAPGDEAALRVRCQSVGVHPDALT